MSWRSKSKIRTKAKANGFKSGFENKIAEQLETKGIKANDIYEIEKVKYTVPASLHTYTVDWKLPNGILVETKGRLTLADRKKHLLVQQQFPELDLRIVFQSAKTKISKNSKTTYADWCDKHGIIWADKQIPAEWFGE